MEEKKRTLKEIVYNATIQSIVNGEYAAGQILNEQTLIEQFGYSKSPIREALIMLCNEGVLRNIPRYGYEVVRLTASDIDEIMDYRRILECGLLRSCFRSISDRQLEQLKELHRAALPQAKDALTQWENNQAFHMTLAGFSGNEYALKHLRAAMKSMRIAYAQTYWRQWDTPGGEVLDLHIEIIRAIEQKNLEAAVTALHRDLTNLRK